MLAFPYMAKLIRKDKNNLEATLNDFLACHGALLSAHIRVQVRIVSSDMLRY